MLNALLEHPEMFAHVHKSRSLVQQLEADAPNRDVIFALTLVVSIDNHFLDCRGLFS